MATARKITKKSSSAKATEEKKVVQAMELPVFSMDGKEVSKIVLPPSLFSAPWRNDLVHQVVTAMQANLRQNRAHTKNRAEVSGGGRKPWKQKGTGQARHGSTRSPLWRHGGITFGPRSERDYSEKINRKMRLGALLSVLSRKARDGELVLVDELSFASPKTKEALAALVAVSKAAKVKLLSEKGSHSAFIAFSSYNRNAIKSFNNLQGISTGEVRDVNPMEILSHKYLVIEKPAVAFEQLVARLSK